MPMPSSGIIVVEKPSTAPNSRITSNTSNSFQTNRHNHHHQHHTPHHNHQHPTPQQQQQPQNQQQNHLKYYEYYDANENTQLSSLQHQQTQQHSSIVVDGSVFQNQAQSLQNQQQQQSMQLGGGRKLHTTKLSASTSSPLSSTALTSSSSSSSSSLSSATKPNLHIQAIKAGSMPQTTKQHPQQQQQQIIQHTSHTVASASASASATSSNSQQQLHHQSPQQQHVQQVHLANTSSTQHQHHHHQHQHQQPTQHQAHMIQVSEEFLEQAQVQAQNHTTASNMMISATGEVIQQQQIFKIVSTDGATSNMIIDTSGANQNPNATTTSKVLLSNLTVLSKQQAGTAAATIATGQQQSSGATAQTINFVNAKQLYTASSASIPASSAGVVAANLAKQQKFTVASANLGGNFKTSALKQTTNTQYVHQSTGSQQKITMTSGNRNMQMLATARVQTAGNNMNHTGVIASNAATAQTMVLQQPHKFVTTNSMAAKTSIGPGGNVIKKTTGTLRMSNSNNTAAATKLMNSLHAQSGQGVKTFITQATANAQQQQQNIPNQLSSIQQQHHTKGGKSKFVKQYNNAILNSAGAVAIATLAHQAQSTYVNHHKTTVGTTTTTTTKINKINSKYATANVAAQLPPGTQLHQKTLSQSATAQQQTPQQYQASNNSNIKFVNAQGTIIQQQQPLTPQKIHIKQQQQQHQTPYPSIQSFDAVDGNSNFSPQQHQTTSTAAGVGANSSTSGPANTAPLSDDIMMVNGTQMTDELSARILQSMSQKSFINQRYQQLQQQQHPVFQKSPTANNSNNSNMLPPPQTANVTGTAAAMQHTTPSHIQNAPNNNHSNILLSPREYTLYPPVGSTQQQASPSSQQPQTQISSSSSPNHYSSNTSSAGSGGSPLTTANYIANSMATITPHSSNVGAGGIVGGGLGSGSSASSRLAQSAPNSRSQSMERKLHESSMSRKSTEYYKVNIKDYHQKCTFVAPTTATIYATNSSPSAPTSLIDFIIPLPSCTTITTTNTLIASAASAIPSNTNIMSNCATMTTTITSSNNNNNNRNSNHNSLRGSHSNLATAQSVGAPQHTGAANIASSSSSSSSSVTLTSSGAPSAATPSSSFMGGSATQGTTVPPRPPSIPPSAMTEPQAQVIHLQATKTLPGANNASNDDDDIIGEEVRPVPVETHDIRLQILHAVLLDHTYANPMPLELPTTFAVQPPPSLANVGNSTTPGHMAVVAGATGPGGITLQSQQQQWSLGGIGAVTASTGTVANSAATVPTTNYPMYSSQLSRLQQDDDAYSAISNSSRPALGDIDPGEETETAPEAEAEDDSITRCICDLTHDDGYMICCDKCCAWQHVDCMGIDRQNIPEEYLCELCQPRAVDKARARALQVQKRKEQTQLMLAQAQAAAAAGTMGAAGSASGSGGSGTNLANLTNDVLAVQQRLSGVVPGFGLSGTNSSDPAALQLLSSSGANMKKGAKMLKKVKESIAGKKSKKADKLAAAGAGLGGKAARKETKKNTKRKKAGHDGGTVGMTAAEKHAANLRQWIENYELAVTNHYSPELRARLHAITKQPSLLQSILNTENSSLKDYGKGDLDNRATTVPHAGGKILISNLDITPNSPICELRGKYMLTTQYTTQNTAMNMNCPPPTNYHMGSYKAHKTPGPFIFFYQLQGADVTANQGMSQTTTTTTLNPDGTYTTTTTTLPAQFSPPTYLRGPEISVDTRTYGNEARFVRRSCRPNAEIQHIFEKGTIHLFIVALTDIRASTEITIRHEPHDLLAVENKKTNTMVIQPTSTPCACGLSKDCIFGPPLPQLPPAAKSNAGRKSSLALNGGSSGTGNLTAKQRKANQQNLNRNRSTSSSGDSNMGGTSAMMPIPTVALSLNSPNNLLAAKMGKNPVGGGINNTSTALMPLTASCNSNLSNASSSSTSTLTSIMHDSGICTSSSSPSVSIPSPTPHMHSPIQQVSHHHQQQQQQPTQLQPLPQPQQLQHLRPAQILPQQQQVMQSLPTPLILTTDMQQQTPQQQQLQTLQPQQQVLLQSPQHALLPQAIQTQQHQPSTVIAQTAAATLCNQEVEKDLPDQTPQGHLYITTPQPQLHSQLQQLPQQQLQLISPQQPAIPMHSVSADVASQEATLVVSALQSLNSVQPSNVAPVMESLQQQPHIVVIPSADVKAEEQPPEQQPQPLSTTSAEGQTLQTHELAPSALVATPMATAATTTASVSSVCSSANSSPQQQRSPQKNNQFQQHNSHQGRKTPAKQARTTSFSEDNDQQHMDENVVSATPNSSSTPKEKPKLSREDRKMEAILRAIEKMERNQQRKQEQKHAKRQNSGSHNTTPTSPNKTFDSADSSGTKRSNSQSAGGPTRTKKKRKAGNRGAAHNNQRKRRQSRMNSQESIDGCGPHENDTVTSESDGCAAMHSPPIQTVAALKQSPVAAMTVTAPIACETIPNNVDQAAGLLMAFANPIVVSPTAQMPTAMVVEPQSPQRPPQQYLISSHEATASPPPTPPSQVSSACLLIEAAVGPLESNLEANSEPNSADINNAEFKYPLQAKTKKLLMSNWLHQTEETSAGVAVAVAEQQISPPQLACMTGGLDSLVQAALNDFKQTQSEDTELPQNLSIVAQRVEEFIQQTEGGPPTPPPTKHSYEFEQQQQRQMYETTMTTTPAVDLSVKQHQPVVNAAKSTPENRNFNLPLQVSTCSNNSSVKKRWLRQAISEETHEELQNNYSMSPSPTTPVAATVVNTFVNPKVQTVPAPICSPALMTNSVPNGFTTPLKKRRLLLTDKDEEDNLPQNSGDLLPSTPLSPPPVESAIMLPPDPTALDEYEERSQITLSMALAPAPSQDVQEDADVDVEKFEQHESSSVQQNKESGEVNMEQEQDVDVTSPPLEEVDDLKTEIVTKHEPEAEVKQMYNEAVMQPAAIGTPAEFNDQEDDVDILRSPSPGREMIKAEDNLVKIEPEDTSCNDDVKIDVEREESMAADDVMVPQLKREYKDEIVQPSAEDELKAESVDIKQEYTTAKSEDSPAVVDEKVQPGVAKAEYDSETKVESSGIKEEEEEADEMNDELEEPKPKRFKLEENPAVIVKDEPTKQQHEKVKREKTEVAAIVKHEHEVTITKEPAKSEKLRNVTEEVSSSTTATASAMRHVAKAAADTTFSSVDSSTPPLPTGTQANEECTSSVVTPPLQRNKTLSDDDIQARLHNFHKENILFLQSRNKKSKSSSSSNALLASGEHHRNNHKSHSSSTSSANHHHHHHEGKERSEKSDKLSTKHHKNSSSSSSSSGSSKKLKIHKRERTTSSSSSSNSHKNSTSHISSTSTISKNAAINSSTNSLSSSSSSASSSSSSKKLKSLKKSSSGSSTSSNNSTSSAPAASASASAALQNCHSSSSDSKDKHQRQRTVSGSSTLLNTTSTSSTSSAQQTPFGSTKKRQLNFELELTKDLHLVNSVVSNSGKHKRLEDSQGHVSVKKSRKDSSSAPKEEQKNGTNKPYKSSSSSAHSDKEKKSVATTSSVTAKASPTSASVPPHPVSANPTTVSQTEEVVKNITVVTTPTIMTPPAAAVLREHPTLPHFNNVVLTTGTSSLATPPSLATQAMVAAPTVLPAQPQPPPPPPPSQNIPVHVSNPTCVLPPNHANNQSQPPLLATTPPPGATSPLPMSAVNSSSNHLPFFNTIYGKLLDNPTPSSLTSPVAAQSPLAPSMTAAATSSVASTGVLAEYLDTKLKSYNTLGGYVSHTALFGLNNTPTKDTMTLAAKDATNEMPAPPAPPSAVSVAAVTASSLSLALNASTSSPSVVSAMKIHTKTASHDPRLNPHLTAPEPPPQPKRKLSINEYRKRMQQTSSNESANNSLVSTPTTPPTPMEAASSVVAVGSGIGAAVVINKCTLNSPERLTQSVDSQIQKEIIASSSLNAYDSLNSSNSSSTSNSSLLNDSHLKSSSHVEEDTTKGQFNAAPTLLEKQQESLCARLKSLKEKQGLALGVGGGSRSRFSSFSESVGSIGEYSLRKDEDDLDLLGKRNHSISSSIGGGDLLDNCLEEISSTSTSMSSSREPSPERYISTTSHHQHHGKHVLTASATTTMATSTTTSSSGNSNSSGQTKQQHHHHHHHNNGDKNALSSSNLERKKSVDIA